MAKYELVHAVRSHIGADDDAFNAIRQREDEDGIRGILLQRNVVPTAALALKTNIASLAPLVLPFTELVRPFGLSTLLGFLQGVERIKYTTDLAMVMASKQSISFAACSFRFDSAPSALITFGLPVHLHFCSCWTLTLRPLQPLVRLSVQLMHIWLPCKWMRNFITRACQYWGLEPANSAGYPSRARPVFLTPQWCCRPSA